MEPELEKGWLEYLDMLSLKRQRAGKPGEIAIGHPSAFKETIVFSAL